MNLTFARQESDHGGNEAIVRMGVIGSDTHLEVSHTRQIRHREAISAPLKR
jgi:hypothetical protein